MKPEILPSAKFRVAYIPDSEISTLNDLTKHARGYRTTLWLLLFVYVLVFVTLEYVISKKDIFFPECDQNCSKFFQLFDKYWYLWYILVYFPPLNGILITVIGRYILCGTMYPYQNTIVRESLDRINNQRFGQELLLNLKSFAYTIKLYSGMPTNENQQQGTRSNSSTQ